MNQYVFSEVLVILSLLPPVPEKVNVEYARYVPFPDNCTECSLIRCVALELSVQLPLLTVTQTTPTFFEFLLQL